MDETGRQFVWDAWNRLVEVTDSSGSTIKMHAYDALNRRVSETAGTTTTALYYSTHWQVLQEQVNGITTQQYVWSPVYVDALILRERDTDANGILDERLWVIQDANFNIVALVNDNGTVVEQYQQTPFGVVTVLDASGTVLTASVYGWVYTHQGLRFDVDAGLYDNRWRWYSPTQGRFVSNDPLGFGAGDVDYYRVVGNNPVIRLDPSGLSWLSRQWKDSYLEAGVLGLGQGVVNVANAATDTVIGFGNAAVLGYNYTAGWVAPDLPYIPSHDWSRGLITDESDECHSWSKGLAEGGLIVLTGGTWGATRKAAAEAAAQKAAARKATAEAAAPATGTAVKVGGTVDIEIAAGLGGKRNVQLRSHAERTGGKAYWDWPDAGLTSHTQVRGIPPETFGKIAEGAFTKTKRIHFDLDGIPDPIAFANEGAKAGWVYHGITKAELNLIRSRPDLLEKTTFYRKGKPVDNPFK